MPRWEVCRIKEISREEKGRKYGVFTRYVAVLDTIQGEQMLDQSEEAERTQEALAEPHSKLVGRLLADGWEPLTTDVVGKVIAFRRQVP